MDKNMATPPSQLGRARGVPAVKPKDMKGTLLRLWKLTQGHRKGLGFILLLSALASGSAICLPILSAGRSIALTRAIPAGGCWRCWRLCIWRLA